MQTKVFMLLLVAVMVLGGGLGGAFAGGMALGKSQGKEAALNALPAQAPSDPSQQLPGQFTPEQLQQFRQQFQDQAGRGGALGGAGRSGLAGSIETIEGNTVTINTAQGPLQAIISADTTIQMSVAGTVDDLKTGLRVTVIGQRGEDGTVTARSIIIAPEGADGFFGGGSNFGGSQ